MRIAILLLPALLGCVHAAPPRAVTCDAGRTPRMEREPDGSRAEWCEDVDGLRDGEFRRIAASGRTLEQGGYAAGRESGEWTYFHPNGTPKTRVTWVSGEQTGPTEGFHADGSPAFRGALRAGAQDGVWEEWQRDGRLRYRGEFAAGVRLRESFWHANGELELAGDYRDGLRHGTWTQRSDTGEVRATCRWRRGELAAPCNEHDGAQLSAPAARAEP